MPKRDRQGPTNSLVTRVHQTMVRYDLIQSGEHIVIGVSGGPDSTCLAAVLHECMEEWDLTLHLAHLNYGTRGKESEADEQFVRCLAQHLNLEISIERVTSDDLANSDHGSFQVRARTARYRYFERVAQQRGAHKIATGHTADDQAETVLMWALRGAGLTGLGGIPAQRGHQIIRPLISVTRTDVLTYLDAKHLTFQTDSTNENPVYLRNRIRHDLIPLLQTYNPQIRRSLSHLAEIVSEDEKVLNTVTKHAFHDILVPRQDAKEGQSCHISRSRFLDLPRGLQRRCIREAVTHIKGDTRRLTFLHIEKVIAFIAASPKPSAAYECAGVTVNHHHDVIAMTKVSMMVHLPRWEAQCLSVPDEIQMHSIGCRIRTWREPPVADDVSATHGGPVACDPMVAHFDEDTFGLPLTVRPWRAGDVFCPSGMGGKKKKLQDYFVDTKVPKGVRSQIPLIVAPEGILWIPGYRQDDRFRCRSTTQHTCSVQIVR
ncbi:MAG TPA: tRNA lysidine(34) synthetase TilS [Nitrospirales bacterium]|nr:tRNA lysidine(34) synthetase TilS [Nitrospirales bacterium]